VYCKVVKCTGTSFFRGDRKKHAKKALFLPSITCRSSPSSPCSWILMY
jgi:hypothetical protein